ncbi:programmed cell death 1 ligand 1 [Ornithorhynchus anatinus]|uniref:CD274 molecule n=1 Tax=Ornithorhynchus anatinus TaxID=9258 RepID=F6TJX0_ORNAN|nr:programmed cell death 1 ligand 1 [Ornithorhynchus anatinus]
MKILPVFTFMLDWQLLNALFEVEVLKESFTVVYGSNVTMECSFPFKDRLDLEALSVYWDTEDDKHIVKFVKGKVDLKIQHHSYRGRATLLKDKLLLGKAMLQITNVQLTDAGVYRCLIGYEGADYKWITLTVQAPYSKINQRISRNPTTLEYEMTCQSEGYPEASVIWKNNYHEDLSDKAITNSSRGPDMLFNVTSTLGINATVNDTFYCFFWNKKAEENTTAVLIIPEQTKIPLMNNRNHLATLTAAILLGSLLLHLFCSKICVRVADVEKWDCQSVTCEGQRYPSTGKT